MNGLYQRRRDPTSERSSLDASRSARDLLHAVHALLRRRASDRARGVHGVTLILARRLPIRTTGSIDSIDDGDVLLLVRAHLEVNLAVAKGEEGEILAGTDTVARVELSSARTHTITPVSLHSHARTHERATRSTFDIRPRPTRVRKTLDADLARVASASVPSSRRRRASSRAPYSRLDER